MNTIEQPGMPGGGSPNSTGRSLGARTDTADVVLLLVTILALMGVAAGIAIGFPLALEIVATNASAATGVTAPHQARERRAQSEEDIEEEAEPFVADDIRTAGLIYAAAAITGSVDRSAPEICEANC